MMRKFLFYFAATAWILGLIVHLLSFAGYDIAHNNSFVWVLHAGVFIVWIPSVFILRNNEEFKAYNKGGISNMMNPSGLLKIIFRDTPGWLIIIAIGGFVYAIINFILFFTSLPGTPDFQNGQYILHNHGHLIKIITEQEFHRYNSDILRGFSGHWLAFYGLAAAVLFPFKLKNKLEN